MKSEYPFSPFSPSQCDGENELQAQPSRLLDEKASGESDVKTPPDSAHQPTGLNNPFWN